MYKADSDKPKVVLKEIMVHRMKSITVNFHGFTPCQNHFL